MILSEKCHSSLFLGLQRSGLWESSMNLPFLLPLSHLYWLTQSQSRRGSSERAQSSFLTRPCGWQVTQPVMKLTALLGTPSGSCSERTCKNAHPDVGASVCSSAALHSALESSSTHSTRSFSCGLAAPKGSPLEQDSKSFSLSSPQHFPPLLIFHNSILEISLFFSRKISCHPSSEISTRKGLVTDRPQRTSQRQDPAITTPSPGITIEKLHWKEKKFPFTAPLLTIACDHRKKLNVHQERNMMKMWHKYTMD